MILSAIVERLKRRSKGDFKGRHFEASLILQAVSWYLRYALSYRDVEELFLERSLAVDHATLNRWSWPTRRCSSAGSGPSANRTAGRFALTKHTSRSFPFGVGRPSVTRRDEGDFAHRIGCGEGMCPQTRLWAQRSDGDTERGRKR